MSTQQSRNGNLWITVLVVFVLLLIAYFWWSGGLGTSSPTAIENAVEENTDSDDTAVPTPADQSSGDSTAPATAEPPASGN